MPLPPAEPLPAIETLIPHRAPFRLVDRIVSLTDDAGCCVLELSRNDSRLQYDLLPAVYLVEALAQSAAAYHGCALRRAGRSEAENGMLVQIDSAVLHAPARAGDNVTLDVRRTHQLGGMVRFTGCARVGDQHLAEAQFTVARGTP